MARGNGLKPGLNDGIPQLSAVVTDGYSDWSLAAVPEWVGEEVWRTVRVARYPYPTGNQAGPYTTSPTREGFEVTFTRWSFTRPDQDLHTDPDEE